jgi:Reductase C-terminal
MEKTRLRTATLGETGLEITRIGFGAWAIGGGGRQFGWGPQDDDDSVAAIHHALAWASTGSARRRPTASGTPSGADYNRVATFFTESFGLTLKVFGDISHHDDRVARGSFSDGNAIVLYFADGRLVASLQGGQDDETEKQLMELVGDRAAPCDMLALADESAPLNEAFATPSHAGVAS